VTSKSDLIRGVLTELPDASAPEIADVVFSRYGVTVAVGSVRAVKSRDNARGEGLPGHGGSIPSRYRPRGPAFNVDPPQYDDDSSHVPFEQPIMSRTSVRTQTPVPIPERAGNELSPEDLADEELYALIDRVEYAVRRATAGHMQQVTGNGELIQTIADICDDPALRAANKPFRYELVSLPDGRQTLRLYSDTPVPIRPVTSRGKRARQEPGCEWCADRQAIPGVSLYLVRGGALGNRQRILCVMHAEPEVRAGATATPYRVYQEIYSDAAVIVPAKTPMQELRERVIRTAQSVTGISDQFV
jgi:hypothetical protein